MEEEKELLNDDSNIKEEIEINTNTKIYSVNFSLHEYQYEKDVLKTMMVRDYCERCVNEKSK